MTDELSIVLGSTLARVTVAGAVIVAMKMALLGQFVLAAGLVLPLLFALYLMWSDAALLA